jgi:MFS family permease
MLLVGAGVGLGANSHSSAGYAGSVLIWTLGEIGIAVMFGAVFADLAPADLRGRYMGVASTTWSIGGVLGPLIGTVLLDQTGRTALGSACAISGIALFAGQQALAPTLRCRTAAQGGLFAQREESGQPGRWATERGDSVPPCQAPGSRHRLGERGRALHLAAPIVAVLGTARRWERLVGRQPRAEIVDGVRSDGVVSGGHLGPTARSRSSTGHPS